MQEPARLALVAASASEAALVRRQLALQCRIVSAAGTLWQGQVHSREVVLLRCGMGAERAAAGLQWVLHQCRLWGVLSVGFAGGLQPQLATGDAVLVTGIHAFAGQAASVVPSVIPDAALTHLATTAATRAALARHVGGLLSHIDLLPRAIDKQTLGRKSGALAIDMESYSLGHVAAAHHVPFTSMRTIFDTSDEDLCFPAEVVVTPDGRFPWSRFLGFVTRHPLTLTHLPHLWRHARIAGTTLRVWLHHFFTLLHQEQS